MISLVSYLELCPPICTSSSSPSENSHLLCENPPSVGIFGFPSPSRMFFLNSSHVYRLPTPFCSAFSFALGLQPADAETQKAMMSWYFKKQQEEKVSLQCSWHDESSRDKGSVVTSRNLSVECSLLLRIVTASYMTLSLYA